MEEVYKIPEEYIGNKRGEYLKNAEACMLTAYIWSLRSKDPSTQVGACFVSESGRIISVGYNGTPNGWSDDEFPWDKPSDAKHSKYSYVVHAEMNAIANYDGPIADFRGSTLYVTLFPCENCAKNLVQFGIKKIVYLSDKYVGTDGNESAKLTLSKCGIEVVSFEEINENGLENLELPLDVEKEKPKMIRYIKNNG